jgi:hypothetical protein
MFLVSGFWFPYSKIYDTKTDSRNRRRVSYRSPKSKIQLPHSAGVDPLAQPIGGADQFIVAFNGPVGHNDEDKGYQGQVNTKSLTVIGYDVDLLFDYWDVQKENAHDQGDSGKYANIGKFHLEGAVFILKNRR